MKTTILIIILTIAITFGLSGCMMKKIFSNNMGMMGNLDTKTTLHKNIS